MDLAQLKQAAKGIKDWSQRYRWPLTMLGAILLLGGLFWSVRQLDFDPAQVRPEYLVFVALVLVPAGLVVAAINLQ
ncbi:MAG: hypothetical protein AAGK02_06945, partial [Pseudomonadota bacterium]